MHGLRSQAALERAPVDRSCLPGPLICDLTGRGSAVLVSLANFPEAQVQSFYNVARPDVFGRWNLRVQLQLLFPKNR